MSDVVNASAVTKIHHETLDYSMMSQCTVDIPRRHYSRPAHCDLPGGENISDVKRTQLLQPLEAHCITYRDDSPVQAARKSAPQYPLPAETLHRQVETAPQEEF